MRPLVLRLMVAALTGALAHANAEEVARLDQLLADNRIGELLQTLQRSDMQEPATMAWLRRRAEEGHVFAQYELADRQQSTNVAEALRWYAKGRLYRILDAAECRDKPRAGTVSGLFDLRYLSLELLQRKHELPFAEAIEQALREDEASAPRPSPQWICSPGEPDPEGKMLLPEPMRSRERTRQRDFLVATGYTRVTEARLNANLNPDRFEIIRLPDPLHGRDGSNMEVWVTNDILLFRAYEKPFVEGLPVLYRWDGTTGKLHRYGAATLLCAFQGYVSYVLEGKLYEGPFGHERPVEGVDVTKQIHRRQCKHLPVAPDPLEQPLDMGGVLKYTREPRPKYEFYPEGSATAIEMPFNRISSARIRYSELLGATVLPRSETIVGASMGARLWILYPDGRVEARDVPPGPWHSGYVNHLPVRDGWILPTAMAGVYLLRGNQVVKIASGHATGAAVSPDGCSVAVRMNVGSETGSPYRVIRLCKGK